MQPGDVNNTGSIRTTEPVMTLINEEEFFLILTELPGIAEESIKIELENHTNSITIIASDTKVHYKKVIIIPCDVKLSKKRFSDGVLEISLKKLDPDTP